MTEAQYNIISHALGVPLTNSLPKEYYRNRFIAGDTHTDIDILNQLVDLDLMTKSIPMDVFGGDRWWEVTPMGIAALEAEYYKIKNPIQCAV